MYSMYHSICEHVLIVKGNHAKKQAITLIKLVILLQLKKGWTFDFYLGHFTFLKSQMQESFSKNPLLIFFLSIHARNCCERPKCSKAKELKTEKNGGNCCPNSL